MNPKKGLWGLWLRCLKLEIHPQQEEPALNAIPLNPKPLKSKPLNLNRQAYTPSRFGGLIDE